MYECVHRSDTPALFGWLSFHYVSGEREPSFYTSKQFRRRVCNLVFFPSFVGKIVGRLANRSPEGYEKRWTGSFPAWFVYFGLEVIKSCARSGA
jgi:hypothetical protein